MFMFNNPCIRYVSLCIIYNCYALIVFFIQSFCLKMKASIL